MTRRDELLALADRCERAKGPDRELDERIGMAIGLKRTMRVGHECLGNDRVVRILCPAYSTSLDAAMTLVPKDCLAMVRHLWDGDNRAGQAVLNSYVSSREEADGKMWAAGFIAVSATPALALCAAALRAKAAMEPSA